MNINVYEKVAAQWSDYAHNKKEVMATKVLNKRAQLTAFLT
jgi:hypothetical protein